MKYSMRRRFFFLLFLVPALAGLHCRPASDRTAGSEPGGWIEKISTKHPRIFINDEIWKRVEKNCREIEELRTSYAGMKDRVDGYPEDPGIESDQRGFGIIDGKKVEVMDPRYWGREAIETAFVFLMTKDRKYLEKARKMLVATGKSYELCLSQGMAAGDYHHSEFHNAFAAYDWIYNDLSARERKEIITPMMNYAEGIQNIDINKIYFLARSDPARSVTGLYGAESIPWYAGLAAYNDGICDELALKHLKMGYEYNQHNLNGRERVGGRDGGYVVATVAYSLGAYIWSEINFFYTWRSAAGEDIARNWRHFSGYPLWTAWSLFPGDNPSLEYGIGDALHWDNELRPSSIHYLHVLNLVGKDSESGRLAADIYRRTKKAPFRNAENYPCHIFLVDTVPADAGAEPAPEMPHARIYNDMGVAYMRSGTDSGATYCAFITGTKANPGHAHYDQQHFTIYKNGFLALDPGSREYGALGDDFHIKYYYPQTVAHNAVLIHTPGEPVPDHWGPKFAPFEDALPFCDGGQYRMDKGKCLAFETNDSFTYIADDATGCYRQEKCELALRQFLFVYPNYFVIFDKVRSARPDYGKEWLIHTQSEPSVAGGLFSAEDRDGRMFCRTLLPADRKIDKIGGPGKEFWASGRNWELEPKYVEERARQRKAPDYFGAWRISVSPDAQRKEDFFLHLIEVGKRSELNEMTPSKLLDEGPLTGVEFQAGDTTWQTLFVKDGLNGGKIRAIKGGRTVFEKEFSKEIMPQD